MVRPRFSWLGCIRDEVVAEAEGSVSTARGGDTICSRRSGSAHSWRSGQPGLSTPVDGDVGEARLADLLGKFGRRVEVGGGKELRLSDRVGVAVLAISEVTFHDRSKDWVVQPTVIQPVQQRGE